MEKIKAWLYKHFHKKSKQCSHCQKQIDYYVDTCPYCFNKVDKNLNKCEVNVTYYFDQQELLLFLVGSLGFLIAGTLILMGINSTGLDDVLKTALGNLIAYLLIIISFGVILQKSAIKLLISFKKFVTHYKLIIISLILLASLYLFSYLYQLILINCGVTFSGGSNQSAIESIILKYPALGFFLVTILAPIVEELTYRVGLFTFLKKHNRILAYIITILIFALLHMDFGALTDINLMKNEWLNLPLYLFPSLILTISYEYLGIGGSFSIHLLNNLISFIVIISTR